VSELNQKVNDLAGMVWIIALFHKDLLGGGNKSKGGCVDLWNTKELFRVAVVT
jgi:hypothetical protein